MKKTIIAAIALAMMLLCSCGEKDYVDLGLSVKWAKCNIGAALPQEAGEYITWGGLETQDRYSRDDYKFAGEEEGTATKYNAADGLTRLESCDDVATVRLGDGWRMPANAEFEELVDKCTFEWCEVEGVTGAKFTAENGNWIFFPAVGSSFASFEPTVGSDVRVWSSEIKDEDTGTHLYITSSRARPGSGAVRYIGYSIRPVHE